MIGNHFFEMEEFLTRGVLDPDAALTDGEMQCKSCERIVPTEALKEYEYEIGSCGKEACTAKCIADINRELLDTRCKLTVANDLAYRLQGAVKAMRTVAERITQDTTKEEGLLAAGRIRDLAYTALHPVKEHSWERM